MAKERNDTEIDFNFDDEANAFISPTETQYTALFPTDSADFFEQLFSSFFQPQQDAHPVVSDTEITVDHSTSFNPLVPELRPMRSLADAAAENSFSSGIDPSAIYQQVSVAPVLLPPTRSDPPSLVIRSGSGTKRPRTEHTENRGGSAESSSRKRRRTAVPRTTIIENGRIFSTPIIHPDVTTAHTSK